MSLAQVTVVATQVEKERRGYQAISLTNFALTTEPEISAGSVVEIGDALFEAAANTAITGWGGIAVSSDVYIRLVVTGAAADPEFTTTAPTWSLTKQGWYDATETKRYVGGLYKDAAGDYTLKFLYRGFEDGDARPKRKRSIDIGDWNMPTGGIFVNHGLTPAKIISVNIIIRNDADTFRYPAWYINSAAFDIRPTQFYMFLPAGSSFNSADFNAVGYNRGWIEIEYTS